MFASLDSPSRGGKLIVVVALSFSALFGTAACNGVENEQPHPSKSTAVQGPPTSSQKPTPSAGVAGSSKATLQPAPTQGKSPQPIVPSAAEKAASERAMKQQKVGSILKTVASKKPVVKPPVALTATGSFGNRVSVKLLKRESVRGEARLPGEVSGPAVKLTIQINNESAESINLDAVVVDVRDANGLSASPLLTPPAKSMSGSLLSGNSATGVYLFTLAVNDGVKCTVNVSYTGDAAVVVFRGDLP